MAEMEQPSGPGSEARLILRRSRDAMRFVPWRHRRSLIVAAFLMALAGASNTIIAVALGRLVDRVAHGGGPTEAQHMYYFAALWLGLIAGAYVLREGLNVVRRYLVENACSRLTRDLSLKLVGHMMKADLGRLSHDKVGAIHARMIRSVDGLVRFLRLSFLDFFPAIATGGIALIAALSKSWILGLVMLGVTPMAVFLTIRQIMSQKGVRLELMRNCEQIDGALVEQMGGIEYVRAANTHPQELKRLAELYEKRRRREIRHHIQMSLFGCAKALNEGFFHVLVLGVSICLAIQGTISYGDVLTFSVLFLNVMAPLGEVHRVLDEGHEASLRVGDLLEMLAHPEDRSFQVRKSAEPRLVPGEPAIELMDLAVEYQTPYGELVRALDGVSLTIRHGETIGVAGRSGCGKSTWLKALLRLTHPASGCINFGGICLNELSREAIGRLVGYVGQQPFIFTGTVAENIAYANKRATREEIQRAAELASIHDEIMMMPGGYDAPITERGQNLSGGQRQRLSIARVLLKQPPVLILDEATSALDNISERQVQRALGVRDPNRTTIIVAHRLTTLRDADRIVVFDNGRIVETGTYDDLLCRGGLFSELVASAENGVGEATPMAACA